MARIMKYQLARQQMNKHLRTRKEQSRQLRRAPTTYQPRTRYNQETVHEFKRIWCIDILLNLRQNASLLPRPTLLAGKCTKVLLRPRKNRGGLSGHTSWASHYAGVGSFTRISLTIELPVSAKKQFAFKRASLSSWLDQCFKRKGQIPK